MKRDPELIRKLLLLVEENGVPGLKPRSLQLDEYSQAEIIAHFNMLADGGMIVGEYARSSTNNDRIIETMLVFDLTWAGHEYIDLIRDEKVWRETKRLSKRAGAGSVEFLIEIAKSVARNALIQSGVPIT